MEMGTSRWTYLPLVDADQADRGPGRSPGANAIAIWMRVMPASLASSKGIGGIELYRMSVTTPCPS